MQNNNDDMGLDSSFSFGDFSFGDEDKRPVATQKKEELSELLKKFKAQSKEERKTFIENVDSEYWVAICFQSREQKDEFLVQAGLAQYGDKYLDGMDVAEHMGIHISHLTPKIRKTNISKTWLEFTK